jgi:hypothetical protein
MLRSRVKKLEEALKQLAQDRASDHVEDNIRRVEDRKQLEKRIQNLEETLSELTGNAPGMWTQVAQLRQEINDLVKATGCERHLAPAKPAEPARVVIRKIPRVR